MTVESIKGKQLNKGEWAEFYVMIKLLGEGKLYAADKFLKKNLKSYLDILKIIREELETNVFEYVIDEKRENVDVTVQSTGEVLVSVPMKEFRVNANNLFNGIKDAKGASLPAPDSVCDFARVIYVSKPKAPAVKALKRQFGGKNDIFIEVRDSQTAIVSVMGFSIKSRFSHPATLYNAGTSSQFLFQLSGCNDDLMVKFNSISDNGGRGWQKCRRFLSDNSIAMTFSHTQNPIYADNMLLIRDSMADIMAWCVKDRLIDTDSNFQVMETVERMAAVNPLKVRNPDVYYEKSMKDFLMASFTGMTASQPWDGKEQVNGGYIVVMENGDVLCYHSADRESFRDYLYKNTHFEYVSADKFKWGYILKDNGKYYLPLNMSIRFNTDTR